MIPTSCWIRLSCELQLLAQLQVQSTERLVEQQHLGAQDQRAGERDALLLSAGELARTVFFTAGQVDQLEHLGDPGGELGAGVRRSRSPNATFSNTLRCGNSAYC